MTGESLYNIQLAVAGSFGESYLMRSWNELTYHEQAEWDRQAYEQDLRDREESAIIREQKGARCARKSDRYGA